MNCQKQKSPLSFETALQRAGDLQQDSQLSVSVAARNGHKNRASDARAESECAPSASLTGRVPDNPNPFYPRRHAANAFRLDEITDPRRPGRH